MGRNEESRSASGCDGHNRKSMVPTPILTGPGGKRDFFGHLSFSEGCTYRKHFRKPRTCFTDSHNRLPAEDAPYSASRTKCTNCGVAE